MNSSPSPQDPSAQRQVGEKGPEGARAPGGLPEVTPLCQEQELLQLRGGGQRAPVQLPGREWLCQPSSNDSHTGCDGCHPTRPSRQLFPLFQESHSSVGCGGQLPATESAPQYLCSCLHGSERHHWKGLSSDNFPVENIPWGYIVCSQMQLHTCLSWPREPTSHSGLDRAGAMCGHCSCPGHGRKEGPLCPLPFWSPSFSSVTRGSKQQPGFFLSVLLFPY